MDIIRGVQCSRFVLAEFKQDSEALVLIYSTLVSVVFIPNSVSWPFSTTDGALVNGHDPVWVLGNAMTSRMDLDSVINMAIRSKPNAIPP